MFYDMHMHIQPISFLDAGMFNKNLLSGLALPRMP